MTGQRHPRLGCTNPDGLSLLAALLRSTGFLVGTAPTRQAFAAGRATKRVRDAVEPNHAPSMVGVHRSRATHGSSAARLPERAPGPRRRWCETRRHCALQDATTADAETDNPPTLGGPRPSWRQRGAEEATRPLDPGGHDGGDPTLWETPANSEPRSGATDGAYSPIRRGVELGRAAGPQERARRSAGPARLGDGAPGRRRQRAV